MRQPSYSSPRRWIALAVQKLTARRVVETLPTLEVSPVAAPVSRKTVLTPSSRFAPAEDTLPPASPSSDHPGTTMVTELPVFASTGSPRRSSRPAGSPVVNATPVSVNRVVDTFTTVSTTAESTPAENTPEESTLAESTIETIIEETTGGSPRQGARSRASRQTGPVKVTVGDNPATAVNSAAVSRERIARESYALKSRELERAADERLAYEQQLVERRIREQLEARQRELDSSLDEILEDTVILPRSIERS